MPGNQISNPHRRRVSESPSPYRSPFSQHPCKKQKRGDESELKIPSAFWDNLSTTYLTKPALLELDQRNAREAPKPQPHRSPRHRPLTRRVLAEFRASPCSLASPIDYLDNCESRDLTSIKRTARHGGPDLRDIRGVCGQPFAAVTTYSLQYQGPPNPLGPRMSSSRSISGIPKRISNSAPTTKPTHTTTTKSTSPYDRNFEQKLIDGGVYPAGYRHPNGQAAMKPENWEEIHVRLRQRRPSLSPSKFSEEDFEKFVQADMDAAKEKQVTTSVIPIIEGNGTDTKCISGDTLFTNFEPLTDGTLVPGKPDIYYGARPEQLVRPVRDELGGQVVPSTQDSLPIAPSFFVEVKGPDGLPAVAKRQATYVGALGARAIHTLRSYGQEPVYDHNAYTITSTYLDGQLKMYSSHVTRPSLPGGRPEYFMTQLNAWSMTGNIETFRQGVTAYRNARDWAKEHRDEAIRMANKMANKMANESLPKTPAPVLSPEPTSTSGTTNDHELSMSQESQTEGGRACSAIIDPRDCRTPPSEPSLGTQPAKRSSEQVEQRSPLKRKRHNSGDDAQESQPPEPQSLGTSGLSQQFGDQVLGEESDSESSEAEHRIRA